MDRQEPPLSSYGLTEGHLSSRGDLELENNEETHRSFSEVALVLGDKIDKGLGTLSITDRCPILL